MLVPVLLLLATTGTPALQINGMVEENDGQHTPIRGASVSILGINHVKLSSEHGEFSFILPERVRPGQGITLRAFKDGWKMTSSQKIIVPADPLNNPIVVEMTTWPPPKRNVSIADSPTVPNVSMPSSVPNVFREAGSPDIWFQRAKEFHYRIRDRRSRAEGEDNSLALVRRYNSTDANQSGCFGAGWHHPFESRVDMAKSTLCEVVYVDNSGATVRFSPLKGCAAVIEKLKAKLPSVKGEMVLSDVYRKERQLKVSLLGLLEKEEYLGLGLNAASLRFLPGAPGMGAIRILGVEGQLFDSQGKLRVVEHTPNPVEVLYDVRGRFSGASDEEGRFIEAHHDVNDLVSEVSYENGAAVSFSYDAAKRLIATQSFTGVHYRLAYDTRGRLSEIVESHPRAATEIAGNSNEAEADPPPVKITYDPNGWRTKVERGSQALEWVFHEDAATPSVTQERLFEGKPISKTLYEFDTSSRELRVSTDNESPKTFVLTRCACRPLRMKDAAGSTEYSYDAMGRLIALITPTEERHLTYHETAGKVDSVKVIDLATRKVTVSANYEYDTSGNLCHASNSDGASATLAYDDHARIETLLTSQQKGPLRFEYNSLGQPIVISSEEGSIRVEYSADGEILHVNSVSPDGDEGGRSLGLSLTSAFQRLTELIDFAKVPIDTSYSAINDSLP